MYEGIEDIFQLLDTGRLKEAMTQLQGISVQTNQWELRNRIESTLMAYGYMLQYAEQGMDDPNRRSFYQQTLRTAYELTDATNIALLSLKKSSMYYDRIRTFTLHPSKAYSSLLLQLEQYTEDISTAPLLYHDQKRLEEEHKKIHQAHEAALTELFEKTWATPFWTDNEAKEATEYLQSVLINTSDLAVMVSAATLSLLRIFDAKKFTFLLEAYEHEELQVNQRAIVGIVTALAKHEKRMPLYPEIISRLSLLCEENKFQSNLHTIQMQLLITRETTKIDKKMREEIIPEMMKNAKQLNDPKFRFDESEDSEDSNPEWEEWMDKNGINEKIKEMGEWQLAGADVYMGSFAQLKHYPFFNNMSHWFYPFDLNYLELAPIKKDFESSEFSPLKLVAISDFFCNSDKYSLYLTLLNMPKAMKDVSLKQMEQQLTMNEENKSHLDTLLNKKPEAHIISRQYIQDLYRFFKLWKFHNEEEDIFLWKFNLWENPIIKESFQQKEFIKDLANYLLQKDYLEEAYILFQKITVFDPKCAEVYQKIGYILQKQKRYKEAVRYFEHADILLPDNIWTNKHLAQCFRLSGNFSSALEYYRKVENVQPDNLNIALQIGQCLVRMENYTDALAYFYKVEYLEKDPDNARRAIAWCSFIIGKHEEALKYYRKLIDKNSANSHDWMNIGHVYFVMYQLKPAIEHYQKAQSFEKSHTAFIEKFNKDKTVLLLQGLSEEDILIMLDLLV